MKFREVIVTHKKQVHVPEGWKIQHSTFMEPKGKEKYPKYSVLMYQDDNEDRHNQKESAIGFQLFPDY